MGTFDYLDRTPHKASTGGGTTIELHTTPIEVDITPSAAIEVTAQPTTIIEVEVTDE